MAGRQARRLEREGTMSVKHRAPGFSVQLGRRLVLAAAGALLISASLGAMTAAATHLTDTGDPSGPTKPWGFNEEWGRSAGGWSAGLATQQLELAGAAIPDSLSAHRFHVNWREVEFTQDQYDWSRTDQVYQAMQANSVEPVMLIIQSPEWARVPSATCPAANPCAFPPASQHDSEWSEFVQLAATRYPQVRAIEVWNEPNLARFWAPAPDPARYATVLALAHDAAVAAGSGAPVVTAGLSPVRTTNATQTSSRDFLREIYNQGDASDFEGIGAHPYSRVEPVVDEMWRELNRLFAVRDNQGDPGTPLWITEVAVSSDATEGVGTQRQGEELVRLYRSIEGHEVESFIIHRLHDVANENPYWNHTGVVDGNMAPKPAYCELGWAIGDSVCSAPIGVDDLATVTEDAPPTQIEVLTNDTEFEGSPTAIDTVIQPPNGTVQVIPGGSDLSYAPDPNPQSPSPSAAP
jgi:polysaccharide biosynthesis protein PslG